MQASLRGRLPFGGRIGHLSEGLQLRREGAGALRLRHLLLAPDLLLAHSAAFLRAAKLVHEPLHLTGGVHDTLLAREEGVALGAKVGTESGLRRAGRPAIAT